MRETKFKKTELGPIPTDWDILTIDEFSDIVTGATPSTENPDYWGGHILWMSSGELNNKVIYDVIGRITKEGYNSASTHMLPANCILIGLAGQGKTRGTVAINKIPLCTNQSIGAILPSEKYDSDYLYFFMDSQYDNLRSISSGDGGRGGLTKKLLLSYEIVAPKDKEEQKNIAKALTDIDLLIRELQEIISKKRAILQGTMQELLTARRRLPGFSEPWVPVQFHEILKYEQPTKYLVSSTEYADNGIPVLTAGKTFILGYTSEKENVYSQLPVIIFDDFTTDSKWVDFPFKAKSSAMKMLMLKSSDYDLRFVFYLMQVTSFEAVEHKRHWITEFSNILTYVPNLKEQQVITQILSDMDSEITELKVKRDKYMAIRQGMMQQLLTGKIRLI